MRGATTTDRTAARGPSVPDPATAAGISEAAMTVPRSEPTIPRRLIGPILGVARVANPWVLHLAGRRGRSGRWMKRADGARAPEPEE
jgi:hypothetical protein